MDSNAPWSVAVDLSPDEVLTALASHPDVRRPNFVLDGDPSGFVLRRHRAEPEYDDYALMRVELHGSAMRTRLGAIVELRCQVRPNGAGMGRALATAAVYGGVNLIIDAFQCRSAFRRLGQERQILLQIASSVLLRFERDRTPRTPYRAAS